MGVSSTGCGTIGGRGGSGAAAWTEASLGILRRADGDEDLAPRVLAIAVSEGGRKWVRLAQAEERGRWEGALVWLLLVPL